MKLISLNLSMFKGINQFSISPNGESIHIRGRNASGKTTVADAVCWLLFDKDTEGKSPENFGIKTLDNGMPMHGEEHSVEAEFEQDGILKLKKVYKEKWTNKKGNNQAELTGHTTDYYWNDEPVTKTDYTSRLGEILTEDTFKILTIPTFFAQDLHWAKRKNILLDVVSGFSDDDIITNHEITQKITDEEGVDLSEYPSILNGKSPDAVKKILREKIRNTKKELDSIPVRIDENRKQIRTVASYDYEQRINHLEGEIEIRRNQIAEIQSGGVVANLRKSVEHAEANKLKLKTDRRKSEEELLGETRQQLRDLNERLDNEQATFNAKKREYATVVDIITTHKQKIESLEAKRDEVRKSEPPKTPVCDICGQPIPDDSKKFLHEKAERLKAIDHQIEEATALHTDYVEDLAEKETGLARRNGTILQVQKAIEKTRTNLDSLSHSMTPLEEDPKWTKIEDLIVDLNKKIIDNKNEQATQIRDLNEEIAHLKEELQQAQSHKMTSIKNKEIANRIQKLKENLTIYGSELSQAEYELSILAAFEYAKSLYISHTVNNEFEKVEWRLFERQLNGLIDNQMCEVLIDGVPYSAGLNQAARIQAGIEIIDKLSRHYGISLPVFLDGRESVTEIPETDLQIISLYVDPDYESLTVKN